MRVERGALPAAALLLVVSAGCAARQGRAILEVRGTEDSNVLVVSAAACEDDPRVTARESDSEVRLGATADRPAFGDSAADCLQSLEVTLAQPLGTRAVVDTETGEVLEVTAPSG